MNLPIFPDRYSPQEAAKILGVAPETLAIWRCTKRYPLPYIKIGRKVFYKGTDLQAFIENSTINPEVNICR